MLLPVTGTVFAVQPRRVVRQDLGVPVLEVRGIAPVVWFSKGGPQAPLSLLLQPPIYTTSGSLNLFAAAKSVDRTGLVN